VNFTIVCESCNRSHRRLTTETEYRQLVRDLMIEVKCPFADCGRMNILRMMNDEVDVRPHRPTILPQDKLKPKADDAGKSLVLKDVNDDSEPPFPPRVPESTGFWQRQLDRLSRLPPLAGFSQLPPVCKYLLLAMMFGIAIIVALT